MTATEFYNEFGIVPTDYRSEETTQQYVQRVVKCNHFAPNEYSGVEYSYGTGNLNAVNTPNNYQLYTY
ncbi:MAG: hypothetical protein ACTIOJ_05900 [Hafnia alvei]|uniref:hypothetical protein n=1 Tax=Hafnia alvei TaxID=569 RepID=UPI003F992D82